MFETQRNHRTRPYGYSNCPRALHSRPDRMEVEPKYSRQGANGGYVVIHPRSTPTIHGAASINFCHHHPCTEHHHVLLVPDWLYTGTRVLSLGPELGSFLGRGLVVEVYG